MIGNGSGMGGFLPWFFGACPRHRHYRSRHRAVERRRAQASIAVGAVGLSWRTLSGYTPVPLQALVEPATLTSTQGLLTVRLEAAEGPV